MPTHKVGEYAIQYTDEELNNPYLPKDIFFNFKKPVPFVHVPNFLTPTELDYLICSAHVGYESREFALVHDYSGGVSGTKVDTNGRYTHNLRPQRDAFEMLDSITRSRVFPLLHEHYEINGNLVPTEGWQFLGYGKDFFFTPHCDNCVPAARALDANQRRHTWWSNTPNRKFTMLIYLNDQRNDYADSGSYSGGDLAMCRLTKDGEPVVFHPKAGDLLTFPSNFYFMHEVKLVTRGYRFSCVSWANVTPK